MNQPNAKYDHVFAIIRVDRFQTADSPVEETITVKKIVRDQAAAEREVERLNKLNADVGCVYFWQMTRLERVSSPEAALDQSAVAKDYAA